MKFDEVIAVRPKKSIYRDGDRVIKLFSRDYSKVDVLNEALNHARVEEVGLNVPEILEVSQTENNEWLIVTRYVEGKTLEQLMIENPKKIDEYLNLFVDLQMEMHSKRCYMLSRLKDKMSRKIDLTNLDESTKYELKTRLESMPKHDKLCHGDFNPSNIIIDKDGKAYILDWSHATQGNASADAARTYLLFSLAGKFELAEKYITLFCEKSQTDKKYVQLWLPIVAASQSVKGKESEKELLLSWINVSDFQ